MSSRQDDAFGDYAAYYDLLYADKDYSAESRYVAALIQRQRPGARRIVEFGCGTGTHARHLARGGFDVVGVERSDRMCEVAPRADHVSQDGVGSFRCALGDFRDVRLEQTFDAALALFHVLNYQIEDADLTAAFATAARHLEDGGCFVFDVWHAPAVLAQRPEVRIKRVENERFHVTRIAEPELVEERHLVRIRYTLFVEDKRDGGIRRVSETHTVRYLWPDDVERFAAAAGFAVVHSEEWMSHAAPGPGTWGVCYVAIKGGSGARMSAG